VNRRKDQRVYTEVEKAEALQRAAEVGPTQAGKELGIPAGTLRVPLDVGSLLGELADPRTEPFDGLPPGTVMGHVHLKVANIPDTVAFYRDVLGFALMAQLGPSAAFLAAGGYHHHLGRANPEFLPHLRDR